jgi:antitoxin VapB
VVKDFLPMAKCPQFAKLFQNGSSQAVRLPREFRFKGDKVRIRRVGKSVVLEPLEDDPEAWLAELKKVPADPDFMKERHQPKTPRVKGLKREDWSK